MIAGHLHQASIVRIEADNQARVVVLSLKRVKVFEMNGDLMLGGDAGLQGQSMAPFLTKLFQIVSNLATDQAIIWTPKGDSFVITDPETFARDILPTYFKHNNIRSFIRQLNTYGFRKRTNISSSDEHLEFFHEKFRRDEPNLLTQIKRCHQPKPSAAGGGGRRCAAAMSDMRAILPRDTCTASNKHASACGMFFCRINNWATA